MVTDRGVEVDQARADSIITSVAVNVFAMLAIAIADSGTNAVPTPSTPAAPAQTPSTPAAA